MNNFEYVANNRLREVLLSKSPVENELSWAIKYTDKAFQADEMNEDISFEVLEVRDEALTNAYDSFIDKDYKLSAKFLRMFWSV